MILTATVNTVIMPKKSNDSSKPKTPITAYALFVRTCREELSRKYPQASVDYNIIAKKCSERWKGMTDYEKKRFHETAELQRQRHNSEIKHYQQEQQTEQTQPPLATSSMILQTPTTQYLSETPSPQHSNLLTTPVPNNFKKVTKKRERKQKDPLAPKKPLSAYFLFCADERPNIQRSQPGLGGSEVARALGLKWKQATPEFKSKYQRIARENRNIYQTEISLYKNQTSTTNSSPDTGSDFPANQYLLASHLEDTFHISHYQFDIENDNLQFDSITHQSDQ